MYVLSTSSTFIGITALNYFELLSTPLTYIVFNGIFGKPRISAFQNFFLIENQLNIKKVMSHDV